MSTIPGIPKVENPDYRILPESDIERGYLDREMTKRGYDERQRDFSYSVREREEEYKVVDVYGEPKMEEAEALKEITGGNLVKLPF